MTQQQEKRIKTLEESVEYWKQEYKRKDDFASARWNQVQELKKICKNFFDKYIDNIK